MLEGLQGVQQIQDDIYVHGKGEEHDRRLEALLMRLQKFKFTLRRIKCLFGVLEVLWFRHVFSKEGMLPDPDKVACIKDWLEPADKLEVKFFLQTVRFCLIYMRPGKSKTHKRYLYGI